MGFLLTLSKTLDVYYHLGRMEERERGEERRKSVKESHRHCVVGIVINRIFSRFSLSLSLSNRPEDPQSVNLFSKVYF